jgi:hypothetical protein
MPELLEDLAGELETATSPLATSRDCGCGGPSAQPAVGEELSLPAASPQLASLTADLDAAMEEEFLSGRFDLGDSLEEAEGEAATLDQILNLLEQRQGLKITLGF